jgi:hypothetical protein
MVLSVIMELGNEMFTGHRAKSLIVAVSVVLIILESFFMSHTRKKSFDWGGGRLAASIFNARVAKEIWPQFFDKLEIYATKNGFQISRTRIHPLREQYDIELIRQDAAISAANIQELLDFEFAVYIDSQEGGSQKVADELTASLTADLKEFPGIKILQLK